MSEQLFRMAADPDALIFGSTKRCNTLARLSRDSSRGAAPEVARDRNLRGEIQEAIQPTSKRRKGLRECR